MYLPRVKNDMNVLKPEYTRNFKTNVRIFFKKFKYAYQRATRGYADCDTWGLDTYLSKLIPDMLIHLADTTHGYPCRYEVGENDEGAAIWDKILRDAAMKLDRACSTDYTEESLELYHQAEEAEKAGDDSAYHRLMQEWRDLNDHENAEKQAYLDEFCDWMKENYYDLWD